MEILFDKNLMLYSVTEHTKSLGVNGRKAQTFGIRLNFLKFCKTRNVRFVGASSGLVFLHAT